jgi:hypothetical protein
MIRPHMKDAPKVMPPTLLCWPTSLEADATGMAVEAKPSCHYFLSFVGVRQIAAEEHSGKMASDADRSGRAV